MNNPSKIAAPAQADLKKFYRAARDDCFAEALSFLNKFGNHSINDDLNNGWTVLAVSAYQGNYKIVELLLDRGAKIDAGSVDNKTALYYASMQGRYDTVALLLRRGASLDQLEDCIETARSRRHAAVVGLLEEEPERRRLIAVEKQRARKAAFNVFTTGLPNGLRTRKLRLKPPQSRRSP